jgi:glyoxylase-like metal-dependent hydrolase (beta-lactamase superfamily II)
MKFGQFEIRSFVERQFKLDGGTMFGVIPRAIWRRLMPPDDNNLISMVTNLFLLRANGKTILFDAGLGDSLSEKEHKIYGSDGESRIESGLQDCGYSVEDINYVILTHLHTDHCAGAVKQENDTYVPRFPNARYVISRQDWEAAMHPNERTAAVYSPERLNALEDADVIDFIEGSTELMFGVSAVHTGGHTEGHYALEMESDGCRVVYYADIVPTSAHLKVPYVAATDLFPLDTMAIKRRLMPELADTDTVLAFPHDPSMAFARIRRDGDKLIAQSVTDQPQTQQV